MRVPRAIIEFARREPFLYWPRSERDWPIQAVPAAGHHVLFLDPEVAEALYGDDGVYNCAGAIVARGLGRRARVRSSRAGLTPFA